MTSAADRLRLAPLIVGEHIRRGRASFARALGTVRPYGGRLPERLLIVPPDLRTSDPTAAADIYAGHFVFAGRLVSTGGRSPFDVEWPSPAWGEVLLGFAWLRHLRAAETALARANARALVVDFLNGPTVRMPAAQVPRVVARRLISWLSHSPVLLADADYPFYRRFLKGVTRDAAQLARIGRGLVGEDRLYAAIGLAYAGLCLAGGERFLARGTRLLAQALNDQILPDGGHAGRNPATIVDLLTDLLPLRQAYAARAIEVPPALSRAIDRMMPMLRLFRHGDGVLALFNGMGLSQPDLIATLLAYDDARGSAIQHAPHSGYERLEAGDAVLIMDVGAPPPRILSREAHAGCLSFELSSGLTHIVVNCGVPRSPTPALRQLSRVTAAHSTLVIGDTSSCRFTNVGPREDGRALILDGPRGITATRAAGPDGAIDLRASHDGYAARFGLVHERWMRLSRAGDRLDGADALIGEGIATETNAEARFHLHPMVRASRVGDAGTVMLVLPNGEAWSFETDAPTLLIEDSVYFAGADGARRTDQIVLPIAAKPGTRVRWSFARIGRVRPVDPVVGRPFDLTPPEPPPGRGETGGDISEGGPSG